MQTNATLQWALLIVNTHYSLETWVCRECFTKLCNRLKSTALECMVKQRDLNKTKVSLCSLPSDPPRQLDVLGHNRDPLGVDGAQVSVFKQADEVSLTRFLWRWYINIGQLKLVTRRSDRKRFSLTAHNGYKSRIDLGEHVDFWHAMTSDPWSASVTVKLWGAENQTLRCLSHG